LREQLILEPGDCELLASESFCVKHVQMYASEPQEDDQPASEDSDVRAWAFISDCISLLKTSL